MNLYALTLPVCSNVLGTPCVHQVEWFKAAGEGLEETAANSKTITSLLCELVPVSSLRGA